MKRKIECCFLCVFMILQNIFFPDMRVLAKEVVEISGKAHIQTYGDVDGVYEDGVLTLGTRGEGKRVESITINFDNNTEFDGKLQYRVHRQTYGWTDWVDAGEPAGTVGEGKRLEAIEIRLVGEIKYFYNVEYAVHIQSYGDKQGWVSNGTLAGTTGESKRLEEIKVKITKKVVENEPSVSYRVHRQTYGWENKWATGGETSGTVGEGKRLEGITVALKDNDYEGDIVYSTHVQKYGWQDEVVNGEFSGTQGEAKRLEAIKIRLKGNIALYYDVYYRVHCQTYGWMPWVKNGEVAGTVGKGKRLEAIEIRMIRKNDYAPDEVVQLYSYRCKYCDSVHENKYELVAHMATYYEQDDVHLIEGTLTDDDFLLYNEYNEYRADIFYNHYIKEGYIKEERECVTNVSKDDYKKHIIYKGICTYCNKEFVDSIAVRQHLYEFYLMDDVHRTAESPINRNDYEYGSNDYWIYMEAGVWVEYGVADGPWRYYNELGHSCCHGCYYVWSTKEEHEQHDAELEEALKENNNFETAHMCAGWGTVQVLYDKYGYAIAEAKLTEVAEED